MQRAWASLGDEVSLSCGAKRVALGALSAGRRGAGAALLPCTVRERREYVQAAVLARLTETEPQMRYVRRGMAAVIPGTAAAFDPVEYLGEGGPAQQPLSAAAAALARTASTTRLEASGCFPGVNPLHLLTWQELSSRVCGVRIIDSSELARLKPAMWVTGHGPCTLDTAEKPLPKQVRMLWEVLEGFTPEERAVFLYFVTASSRLPIDLPVPYIRISLSRGGTSFLPTAATCFRHFRLHDDYPSTEVLREKLKLSLVSAPGLNG